MKYYHILEQYRIGTSDCQFARELVNTGIQQSRNEEGWKKSANGLTGSQVADYLGPNLGPGLNFVKRKMAPKKMATATLFNAARIYKLVHVESFGWKRGKIFWRAAGSFCRSRISMVLNITRDILFWKVKLNLLNMSIFLVISFKGEEFVFRLGRVKGLGRSYKKIKFRWSNWPAWISL